MLRDGFGEFIIDTPGKLKYREVTEEENIGRLNYRKANYIDHLDGDIESSIFFDNEDRKTAINQAVRDPKTNTKNSHWMVLKLNLVTVHHGQQL